jgi:hypothetical protein
VSGARALSSIGLALVCVLAVVTVREVAMGRAAAEAAERAAARSDWPDAIAKARRAAEALVPGSPWPPNGMRRLAAIGTDAEARGDLDTALLAYGAMRTAALETRTLWAPQSWWRRTAEEGLARVAASRKDPTMPRVPVEAMLGALREDQAPPEVWLALLGVCALAMLLGLARLALTGTAGRGARVARAAVSAGFVGYVILVVANARRG